jgi:hypothetical protein|nr:MAG TPA: Protein of unknown function (DUF1071) [Bacteriophage sp.]
MIKNYDELRKVDVSKWIEQRDGADYLNWAKVVDLLHENGAGIVYFEPVVNEFTGSSLYMTEKEFEDSKGNINRVYETAVKIVIDDLEFIQRGPVTNGSNPVKDNSMSQQRLWNCQTRLFVKGVAIRTGLGFDLWLKEELKDSKNSWEDDLSRHDIFKIKERCQQIYTQKLKEGLSVKEIAERLHKTEDEVKAVFTYFDTLSNFERDLANIDTKSR